MLVSQLINNSSSLNQYRLKYDGSSDISSSFIFCLFNGLFEKLYTWYFNFIGHVHLRNHETQILSKTCELQI